ncbi:hypothetical protein MTR67_053621 [Solanum verrucosum]|uniref:Uncharacterized protein n=1 Tax=Solanum verrucosum TaxID=315347 RepID=A0AAF0VB30_SOLVR|nr:hypothetical protein MTR67_053621 [Solanum verrucosum]
MRLFMETRGRKVHPMTLIMDGLDPASPMANLQSRSQKSKVSMEATRKPRILNPKLCERGCDDILQKEKPAYIEPEDEVYSVTEENEAIPPTPRVVSKHCQGP